MLLRSRICPDCAVEPGARVIGTFCCVLSFSSTSIALLVDAALAFDHSQVPPVPAPVLAQAKARQGTHNMYKEFRELSRADAVKALYQDMAARHRARFRSIHVRSRLVL